ncbi:hypothetical protein KEJ44_05305 [Candidatus Bathyarchaeota archaeon]|nr:hypothetical protein [Candidatus Bathyarchaeota archaeon]
MRSMRCNRADPAPGEASLCHGLPPALIPWTRYFDAPLSGEAGGVERNGTR